MSPPGHSIPGCPPPPLPRPLSGADWRRVRIAAYAAFVIGLVGFVWFAGIPTDRLGLAALAIGFLSIGLLGRGWKAWFGLLRDWLPFTAVLLVYDYSRGFASPYSEAQRQAGSYPTEDVHNALGLPLQVRFPIVVDQWLAGGTTPTQWLQAHLHAGDAVPWFGALVSLVYVSHYLVAPVTAVWLWIRDRSAFRVWMSMVIALAVLGLTTYVLLPDRAALAGVGVGRPRRCPGRPVHIRGLRPDRPPHRRIRAGARAAPGQSRGGDALAARRLRHPRRGVLVEPAALTRPLAAAGSTRWRCRSASPTAASTTSPTSSPACSTQRSSCWSRAPSSRRAATGTATT